MRCDISDTRPKRKQVIEERRRKKNARATERAREMQRATLISLNTVCDATAAMYGKKGYRHHFELYCN